ncbi:DUF6624 domain-containing protein [Streptomyces sp. NPDC057579]|uniref:DUF6624 domain-containing protein n=1 Tax=Streptomyces sp. NPDC057579 TaxID=3346172 RepID=UPI0036ADDF88
MVTPAPPQQPVLARELLLRMAADQHARGIREDGGHLPPDFVRMRALDAENAATLRQIIDEHGWPGHSLVGAAAANAAWLNVQHAGLDLQLRSLGLLASAVEQGEATHQQLALLTDRVLLRQGKPQLYGTQYRDLRDGRGYRLWDVTDPDGLDARRAAVGLGPHAAYDVVMRELPHHSGPADPATSTAPAH